LIQLVAAINPDPVMNAQLAALKGVRGIALGWGSREGKGRMSLVVDAPKASSLTRVLPTIVNDYSLTARGNLGLLFSFNMPGPALLRIGEGMLSRDPEAFAEYKENKKKFTQSAGLTPEQLLATFGPELLVFGDSTGTFFAVKISDQQGLQQLSENLAANPNLEYEVRTINAREYHHLAFSIMPEEMPGSASGSALDAYVTNMYLSSKSHLYWTRENDWLIFSQLPQSLFDRHADARIQGIGDWLLKQQRQRAENAVLLLSVEQDHMPRNLYHAYLTVLEAVADMVGAKADLLSLPGSAALKLPATGTYGVQLDLSDPYLRLEFTFEANPFELLLGESPMTTVAAVGILAAIAIPAYQDYQMRAKVAQVIAGMGEAKTAIAEYYLTHGYAPVDAKSTGLETVLEPLRSDIVSEVKIVDGSIVAVFGNAAAPLYGDSLRMTPYASANNPGQIQWRCANAALNIQGWQLLSGKGGRDLVFVESTVADKYLPQICR
jgi:Tfp pilus assembly protein PilE